MIARIKSFGALGKTGPHASTVGVSLLTAVCFASAMVLAQGARPNTVALVLEQLDAETSATARQAVILNLGDLTFSTIRTHRDPHRYP